MPPQAAAAEALSDLPGVLLFPEEQDALANAAEKRRREFTTVRACARAALAKLGVAPVAISRGLNGAPQWPPGLVGSMTHCAGYRAAAVARAADIITIGVDAEPDQPLPEDVLHLVSSAGERCHLAALASAPMGLSWDRLLFSAKESVYKAWYPLTQRWLGFEEAEVTIGPSDGSFAARLLVPGPMLGGEQFNVFAGRWLARNGLILTAIAVPAPGDRHDPAAHSKIIPEVRTPQTYAS